MRRFQSARPLALATILVGAAGAPAAAHHGWADYSDAESQVTGTVVDANLGGPHGRLKVKTTAGVWDVVLSPPHGITRSGLTLAAIPKGATVTARGHRHNNAGRLEIKTERLVVGQRTFNLYPNRS